VSRWQFSAQMTLHILLAPTEGATTSSMGGVTATVTARAAHRGFGVADAGDVVVSLNLSSFA
jgi:hypothetical protein